MTQTRPSIIAAIIVHGGKALLVRRRVSEGNLSWRFPAGEQEPGEASSDTAAREVAEEVGLTVTPVALISKRQHSATGRDMIYIGYEADTATAAVIDSVDLAELAWGDDAALKARIPAACSSQWPNTFAIAGGVAATVNITGFLNGRCQP